ncbi:hypothetical protein THAOC_18212 [Thalassiosira oceanica]|uniref:MYND-type domain-containing protein n=1 Tax=Thalassiosira oceanica TaxID=159749 RepID=K0SJZ9_THAOC|nr:hypothetical protein THAOC_18212 [Thalassiosira oceanica]|eukprot:EJK61326.1 hypothetical protein THAOC_18212 [Thalassiosira oceanica]
MMKCLPVMDDDDKVCANCGKHGSDTVKLKRCTACRLVKYCGVDCQKAHRKQHKKACNQRVAELKDEQLYSQGLERPEGDFCPICTLPIPFPIDKHSLFHPCCMTRIGCNVADTKTGIKPCPFCRAPLCDTDAEMVQLIQARVLKKDTTAMTQLGQKYLYGRLGLQKDVQKAVELWKEAAEFGSIDAFYLLGNAHHLGDGVEKDAKKAAQFWSKAAMQGHAEGRHNLGISEEIKGNYDNAVKNYLISAKMGYKASVQAIQRILMKGMAKIEQYMEAVKGYQDAAEEMKSHDRDKAREVKIVVAGMET